MNVIKVCVLCTVFELLGKIQVKIKCQNCSKISLNFLVRFSFIRNSERCGRNTKKIEKKENT